MQHRPVSGQGQVFRCDQHIARYAHFVGRDNVMAGVDCGFSIHAGSDGVDPDVVWAKMAALAQGAETASRQFWQDNRG